MFGVSASRVEYTEYAEGTWGEFFSPSGRVSFLLTRARLGLANDTDRACRLTNLLSPVREVLEIKNLNFNQLLQRDLDDHRVATELLPYILKKSPTGPGFLPPILAAILPFDGNVAADHFPALQEFANEHIPEFGQQEFQESRFGSSFRFQKMVGPDGTEHPVRFGRISWNNPRAKLVVLDGQHRAMALLAIQRTITNSWRGSTGEKYRFFYEHEVKNLLRESGLPQEELLKQISAVEYPVTICWFPEMHGKGQLPHVAARKLFVDVNKNARAPSESRLVLLSDTQLVNIFTRSLLNRLRDQNPPLPLFAVEYDNPDAKSLRPVRWSVLTNLLIIRELVEKAAFGPRKYIEDLHLTFSGRASVDQMDSYFREQMRFQDVPGLPDEIEEGETAPNIRRDALGNEFFPHYNKAARELIIQRFMEVWGEAILHVLGQLLPWKKHVEAIEELYRQWVTDDAISSLAKDALFEGVGMYWTLRDAFNHWREEVDEGRSSDRNEPEIAKAWRIIDRGGQGVSKARDFTIYRANYYLGRTDPKSVERCEELFGCLNTFACQLGVVMTIASVQAGHRHLSPTDVSLLLVKAWNAALVGGFADKRRLLIFARSSDPNSSPLNMLGKMDSTDAVYFRYFFLELLRAEEAHLVWQGHLVPEEVTRMAEQTREVYRDHLINEKAKALKRVSPGSTEAERQKDATEGVDRDLAGALKHWFKMNKGEYEEWRDRVEGQVRRERKKKPEVEVAPGVVEGEVNPFEEGE